MGRSSRRAPLVALGFLLAATVAGCGDGDDAEPSAKPGVSPPPAENTTAEPATPSPSASIRPSRPITLAFAGDVHFESPIREQLDAAPRRLLNEIAPVLGAADLTVVNLETAITEAGDPAPKEYNFRAPASAFDALRAAGVDVTSMANNHGMDYGLAGLRDSLAAANAADFPLIGIGRDEDAAYRPYVAEIKGQRVAVIGATQVLDSHLISSWTAGPDQPGLASAKREGRLVQEVRRAAADADVVVVFLHWGTESVGCPTEVQRSLARKLVRAGADAILGSHAHVLLGGGYLRGSYVHYGLGNFVFYATPGPGTETGVLTLTARDGEVRRARWTPARIYGGVPTPLRGSSGTQARAYWQELRGCTGLSAQR